MLSDRCKCTLAAGSLITVTRSCGICTRFPFYPFQSAGRLSRPANNERHLLFYIQFPVYCSTLHPKAQGAVCMFCRIFFGLPGRPYSRRCKISHKRFISSGLAACSFIPAVLAGCTSLGQRRWPSWQQWAPARHRLWAKNGWPRGAFFVFCRFTTLNRLQLAWQCGKLIWI